MNSSDLAFLVPDPNDLLARPVEERAKLILELLAREHTSRENPVSHSNFFNRAGDPQFPPKYGGRQREVDDALMEAWGLLENRGLIVKSPSSGGSWFFVGSAGKEALEKDALFERLERFGLDRVKADLTNNEGRRTAHRGKELDAAWEWVRMKEGHAMLPAGKRAGANSGSSFIAESRIDELRKLASPDFDFQKLIRLCEELNSSYDSGNYYATAMLTRGLLDHVPPLFGQTTFAQVANNYSGGGRSFKETMQHLEGAARKIGDGHLHMHIRKNETLPTPQQVYCGPQLDLLLAEIVRIMK